MTGAGTPGAGAASATAGRRALALLPLLGICALAGAVYLRQPLETPPQAYQTARFVQAPSWSEALAHYRPVRPPLYPMVVRGLAELRVPVLAVNPLAFFGLLAWAWCFARRVAPGAQPAFAVALLALFQFHYPALATLTSEVLFSVLAAATLQALAAHLRDPSPARWALAVASAAAACATRYIGLFWLLPLLGLRLALRPAASLRARGAEASAALALALLPAGAWMAHAYGKTGFLSGMDRFGARDVVYRSELGGVDNALFTVVQYGKTLYIDFFSARTWASHEAVDGLYRTQASELAAAGLALAALASAAVFFRARGQGLVRRAAAWLTTASETALLVQALLVFAAATTALWIAGNNDRLYSRFLYPSYPLLVLVFFALYWRMRELGASLLHRAPFVALYLALAAIHAQRILRGIGGG